MKKPIILLTLLPFATACMEFELFVYATLALAAAGWGAIRFSMEVHTQSNPKLALADAPRKEVLALLALLLPCAIGRLLPTGPLWFGEIPSLLAYLVPLVLANGLLWVRADD